MTSSFCADGVSLGIKIKEHEYEGTKHFCRRCYLLPKKTWQCWTTYSAGKGNLPLQNLICLEVKKVNTKIKKRYFCLQPTDFHLVKYSTTAEGLRH
jgi:hypothetical protein